MSKHKTAFAVKGIAALMTLAFMALIRTDADPTLWQVSMVALMLYGANCMIVRTAVRELRIRKKKKREDIETRSIKRWADQDFMEYGPGRYVEYLA